MGIVYFVPLQACNAEPCFDKLDRLNPVTAKNWPPKDWSQVGNSGISLNNKAHHLGSQKHIDCLLCAHLWHLYDTQHVNASLERTHLGLVLVIFMIT